MTKHRSNFEMMVSVLEHCKEGRILTHVSYCSNMSHKETTKYIIMLLRLEFIREQNKRYFITEKGKDFIIKSNNLNDLIK